MTTEEKRDALHSALREMLVEWDRRDDYSRDHDAIERVVNLLIPEETYRDRLIAANMKFASPGAEGHMRDHWETQTDEAMEELLGPDHPVGKGKEQP
jgi:hypothetical protein